MSQHRAERSSADCESGANGATTVDCNSCIMRDTPACEDCVVTFIVSREPGDALVLSAEEARAMRAFGKAGLVPSLRLRHRAG